MGVQITKKGSLDEVFDRLFESEYDDLLFIDAVKKSFEEPDEKEPLQEEQPQF